MTDLLLPTSDLVGVYWLRSLVGVLPADCGVANELPNPWLNDHGPSSWDGRDFVTIVVVSGGVHLYSSERSPVFQIDSWSRPKNQSAAPPWYRANQTVEKIRNLQYTQPTSWRFTLPAPYRTLIRVGDIEVLDEPRRVPNDPARLARYTMDVRVTFVAEGTV